MFVFFMNECLCDQKKKNYDKGVKTKFTLSLVYSKVVLDIILSSMYPRDQIWLSSYYYSLIKFQKLSPVYTVILLAYLSAETRPFRYEFSYTRKLYLVLVFQCSLKKEIQANYPNR